MFEIEGAQASANDFLPLTVLRARWKNSVQPFVLDRGVGEGRGMGRPVFSVEVTNERLEFNVLIRWENGVEHRVRHFGSAQDAQKWIKAEAENWLRMRHGTPDFP